VQQFSESVALKRRKRIQQKSILARLVFISAFFITPAIADYQVGYQWAVENNPESFSKCQEQFGISEEEDGCNDYVQETLESAPKKFGPYNCNEGCNGYEAGYQWAEENSITDVYDCDSSSSAFTEGCQSFVKEN